MSKQRFAATRDPRRTIGFSTRITSSFSTSRTFMPPIAGSTSRSRYRRTSLRLPSIIVANQSSARSRTVSIDFTFRPPFLMLPASRAASLSPMVGHEAPSERKPSFSER